ncbi:cupin domain-containing protein [Blautia sp. RTP21359st1_E11_RTP21359_211015]
MVLSGNGTLTYEGTTYELSAGDCVFIDCRKAYSFRPGITVREKAPV